MKRSEDSRYLRSVTNLNALDATALADLVRQRHVTPLELVDQAISKIETLNPKLNAIITPLFEEARREAKGPLPEGPFRGVPFLLKDLLPSLKGVRMSSGSAFLKDYVPDHDSELVKRFRKAGLIIVGKTNTPEFGLQPTTEPMAFGPTHNPWDLTRTPGGSSGGSAAAVAAEIVPMAHANDGGGSIRIPASCCGVFGLKPSRGRTSFAPDFGDLLSGLIVEHAVTRSVRDSAALLDAIAGPIPGDPYQAPLPMRPFREEVGKDPGPLRIAFTTEAPTGITIHPDCKEAVRETAKLCASLRHIVEEKPLMVNAEALSHAFMSLWAIGPASEIAYWSEKTGKAPDEKLFEPLTWALSQLGSTKTAVDYVHAIAILQTISRQVAAQFENYDLWLTPTLGMPPPTLGYFDPAPDNPLRGFFLAAEFVPFTPIANATGQPAMSVPLFWNKEGLPIGSHFIGRYGEEGLLFRLAGQLEIARPWANRIPTL